jgi:hypothetical protein
MESLSGMKWNGCPASNGITVRDQMEWVSGMDWNTQGISSVRPQQQLSLACPHLAAKAARNTLDKTRLVKHIGKLKNEHMNLLNEAIKIHLAL